MSLFVDSRYPRIGNTFVTDFSPSGALLKSNSFSHLPLTYLLMENFNELPVIVRGKATSIFEGATSYDAVRGMKVLEPRERGFSSASTCVSSRSDDSEPPSPSVQSSSAWASSPRSFACDSFCTTEQIMRLPEDDPSKTTVVAKNLPVSYTKCMLLELLDAFGLKGQYNFAYVPVDFSTQRSFGYAFVNFVTHKDALQFGELFNGFSLWAVRSDNVGVAEWSGAMQGLEKHIERYRDSPMMHKSLPDDVKPSIFKDGVRIAFPWPTKPLKMPRRVTRKPLSSSGAAVAPGPWCPVSVDACRTFATRAPQTSSVLRLPPR
jgi:hypothetical protein